MDNRGAALILVLTLVLTLATLASIGVGQIVSQARYTHHNMSRVQAQYAAQAGMVYALEMLRKGSAGGGWQAGVHCLPGSPCPLPMAANEFPQTINSIDIVINPGAGPQNTAEIITTVDYLYQ